MKHISFFCRANHHIHAFIPQSAHETKEDLHFFLSMELSQLTWESYAKYKIVTKNLYCSTISQQKKTVPNIRIGFHNTWIKLKCLAPKNPPLHLSLSVASYNVRPFLAIRFRARCWERMIILSHVSCLLIHDRVHLSVFFSRSFVLCYLELCNAPRTLCECVCFLMIRAGFSILLFSLLVFRIYL